MLMLTALAVVIGFVAAVGSALLISTARVASLGTRRPAGAALVHERRARG